MFLLFANSAARGDHTARHSFPSYAPAWVIISANSPSEKKIKSNIGGFDSVVKSCAGFSYQEC
jgi:hypothetical protein